MKRRTKGQSRYEHIMFQPYLLLLLIPIFSFNCRETRKSECDYQSISTTLLYNIKAGNKEAIKKMMAFNDEQFWKEGGQWETIEESAKESLDSLHDLHSLKDTIVFYKKSPTFYAIVTILLRQNGKVRDFIVVNFFHPDSPFGCKIESFSFERTGFSLKVDEKPTSATSRLPNR